MADARGNNFSFFNGAPVDLIFVLMYRAARRVRRGHAPEVENAETGTKTRIRTRRGGGIKRTRERNARAAAGVRIAPAKDVAAAVTSSADHPLHLY
jgi:hypothetical protein